MVIYREIILTPTFRRCVDASAKGFEMKEASPNNLPNRIEDVIVNPINPDSKLGVGSKFILKPIGERTRGIASLHCIQQPHGIDLTEECHRSGIKEMHLYHERMNVICPYMAYNIISLLSTICTSRRMRSSQDNSTALFFSRNTMYPVFWPNLSR